MKRKMLILVGTALAIMLASMLVMGQIKHAPIIEGLDRLEYEDVDCHYKKADQGKLVSMGMLDDSRIEDIVFAIKSMEWTLADKDLLEDKALESEFVMTSDSYIAIISVWEEGLVSFTYYDLNKDQELVRAHLKVQWRGESIHQLMTEH